MSWKCNKCGKVVRDRPPPIEHGTIAPAFYPDKCESKICDGKWIFWEEGNHE